MSKMTELLDQLRRLVDEKNEKAMDDWLVEFNMNYADFSLPEIDMFFNEVLCITDSGLDIDVINRINNRCRFSLFEHQKLIRFFHAFFPGDEKISEYIHFFHNIIDNINNSDCVSYCNAMLVKFGICSVPDILMASNKHRSSKLYNVVADQMRDIWSNIAPNFTARNSSVNENAFDDNLFRNLCFGYMKEAFSDYSVTPACIIESMDVDLQSKVEKDIKLIVEKYEDEELEQKLEEYNNKAIDIIGAQHIMEHILHEGALCMESYHWCMDQFESIGDLCAKDDQYLSMCEASYRSTGKLPRYIDNTYDIRERDTNEKSSDKKSDEWINEPKEGDDFSTKKKHEDDEPELPLPEKDGEKGQTIYNITYQNSFNRNRKKTINDSFNNSRMNSDDIDNSVHGVDGDELNDRNYAGKKNVMAAWNQRNKVQKKLQETYGKKKPLSEPPSDLSKKYLSLLVWDNENLKKVDPWVITKDTQKGRPNDDIQFRKYLVRKIEELADERDIEYDGNLVVAGDATDGIYDIELTRYNDVAVVDALRKVSNAVIKHEMDHLSKKPQTDNKTINEAIEYFNQIDEMEEAILGGDPEKDRPFVQRAQNAVTDFNANAQSKVNSVDQNLRGAANVVRGVAQTPIQLVNTVKNFISDLKDRKDQKLKEDILKDKKLRMSVYDMMRSLVKTALPWVILGPLWGTLWNIIALPVRGIKAGWTALRGGPHRDLIIETRDELRAEMEILQDRINNPNIDTKEKHNLMRQLNRMQQEYLKVIGKIHFEPESEKRTRLGYGR